MIDDPRFPHSRSDRPGGRGQRLVRGDAGRGSTQFAEATDDRQWIHVDPARAAAESPFGTTIAHGFLTLSLVSALARAR